MKEIVILDSQILDKVGVKNQSKKNTERTKAEHGTQNTECRISPRMKSGGFHQEKIVSRIKIS